MKELLDKYSALRDEIHTLGTQKSDNDFVKLVTIKNDNDELKETLILLHTNYKNEIQELKSNQIKIVNKMIDQEVALIHKLQDLIEVGKEQEAKTQRTFKIHSIERLLGVIVIVVVIFWGLAAMNGNAFSTALGGIDKIFGNITGDRSAQQEQVVKQNPSTPEQ